MVACKVFASGPETAHYPCAIYVLACLSSTSGSRARHVSTPLRLGCSSPHPSCVRHFDNELSMTIGTVKFFNGTKGFGFIQPENGEKDVFVHVSAVEQAGMDTLAEGQRVSFDVVTERGKLAASNLKAA